LPPVPDLRCAQVEVVQVATAEVPMREAKSSVESAAKLAELVYELLDAHDDTARLAGAHTGDERWAAHLDYLQQLQRVGREVLAHATPQASA
jgi:hypothetical protein